MKVSFIRKKSLHDRNIQNIKNFLKLTTKAFGLKIFSRDGSQLVWLLVVCSTVTKMLVVCSTLVCLFVASSTFIKMFGRVFGLSFAVGRVFDCY